MAVCYHFSILLQTVTHVGSEGYEEVCGVGQSLFQLLQLVRHGADDGIVRGLFHLRAGQPAAPSAARLKHWQPSGIALQGLMHQHGNACGVV